MHDVGRHVAAEGVDDVVLERGDGAGAVHDSLDDDAHERDHGQATVLDLLERHGVAVHAHGVPRERLVDAGLAGGEPAADAAELEDAHDGELHREERVDGEVVLRGAGFVPRSADAEHLGGGDAGDGHHRPAGVHELSLLVVLQALGVGAEAEGVEAEVTGEGAVEVGGRDGGVLDPVGWEWMGWGWTGWSAHDSCEAGVDGVGRVRV